MPIFASPAEALDIERALNAQLRVYGVRLKCWTDRQGVLHHNWWRVPVR